MVRVVVVKRGKSGRSGSSKVVQRMNEVCQMLNEYRLYILFFFEFLELQLFFDFLPGITSKT